jgi:hypothetical protein
MEQNNIIQESEGTMENSNVEIEGGSSCEERGKREKVCTLNFVFIVIIYYNNINFINIIPPFIIA